MSETERLLSPGQNALYMLVHDPLMTSDSLRERSARLPALASCWGMARL
ncbi:hypothetical protein ULG90_09395 [Halopseudomonas pachastrellae]|nr:hypothetical protein ULG90_09395 [Halopseudomonas pachastrellae]